VQENHPGIQQAFGSGEQTSIEFASVNRLLIENREQNIPSVELNELLSDTLTLLSHELDGRQIVVKAIGEPKLKALIDRQEFQQVLINVINNSIQAIDNNGEITITMVDESDRKIRLCVEDSGRGIETEYLPRVFDPFFTVGKAQGTGLGLSVSYGIVRRYGGDMSVSSVVGQGSKFTLTLPAT